MALSPNGQRLVFGRYNNLGSAMNLWVLDLARNVETRLTFGDYIDSDGTWAPDMARIIYASVRSDTGKLLYERSTTGGEERQIPVPGEALLAADDWSADGRFLLYHPRSTELWALPLENAGAPLRIYAPTSGRVDEPVFSPDSQWVAFHSDESGRFEIYLTRFPPSGTGERLRVSANGGVQPQWNRNGRELFFLAPDGTLMAVDVQLGATPTLGTPQPLFRSFVSPSASVDTYAAAPDGSRFLMMLPAAADDAVTTNVIVNWPALLRGEPPRP
jgi:Tol biopolymer transport system component